MLNFGNSQLILDYKMVILSKSTLAESIETELAKFKKSVEDKRDLYLHVYGSKGTFVYQLGKELNDHVELQIALIVNR